MVLPLRYFYSGPGRDNPRVGFEPFLTLRRVVPTMEIYAVLKVRTERNRDDPGTSFFCPSG